ncbi:MAG: VOC family protein [Pseudomonadales bacterium]|nr:VOC family protein [Pseudomonadales bacterium]
MIGYVTLGTNDMNKAAEFYDEIFKEVGAKRIFDTDGFIAWGKSPTSPMLSILPPYDGNPATVGNGVMIAMLASNKEEVDRVHAKALELGAKNEGDPGLRGSGFYIGYFRDMDGNKLNFFHVQS